MYTKLAKQYHDLKRLLFLALAGVLPLLAVGLLNRTLQAQERSVLLPILTPLTLNTDLQVTGCLSNVTILEQTANLLPNPGFEYKIPQASQWVRSESVGLDWDCTNPLVRSHSGNCSARIDGGNQQDRYWFTQRNSIEIDPDEYEYFVFSGFIRSTLSRGEAWIRVVFFDENGNWAGNDCSTWRITDTLDSWIKIIGSAQAPPNAHFASLECRLAASSQGIVWFDDVHLGVATALSISKSDHVEEVGIGEQLTYTIVYANVGREKATDVEIFEHYDSYVDYVSANPAPSMSNNYWDIGALQPGVSGTIVLTVQVTSDTNEHCILENRVHVKSDETVVSVTDIETTTLSGCPNGCHVSLLSSPNPHKRVDPGTQVHHHFWLLNNSTRDGLVTLVAHSSQNLSSTLTPSQTLLPVGSVQQITLTLKVPVNTKVVTDTSWVTATLHCEGGSSAEDSASVTTAVSHIPYVDIEPDRSEYCNSTITFHHLVTNTGNANDRFDINCDAECVTKGCTCCTFPQLTALLEPGESSEVIATVENISCKTLLESETAIAIIVTATSRAKGSVFDQAVDEIKLRKIWLPFVLKDIDLGCSGDPDLPNLDWWDSWGGNLATPSVVIGPLYISPTLRTLPLCGNYAFLLGNSDIDPSIFPNETIPVGKSEVTKTITVDQNSMPMLSFWYRMITYDIKGDNVVNPLDTFEVTINGTLVFVDGNHKLHSSGKCHDMDWDVQTQFPDTHVNQKVNGWRRVTVDLSGYSNPITLNFANWNRDYGEDPNMDSNNTFTYLDSVQIIK